MRTGLMGIVAVLALLAPQAHARANSADYCAAFARDVADQLEKPGPRWNKRLQDATTDCQQRFGVGSRVITEPEPKPKTLKKPPAPAAKPKPKPTPKPEAPAAPAPAQTTKPNLVEGSAEWLAYCKNKYVSFNAEKGTYIGKSGTERKCLVTAP